MTGAITRDASGPRPYTPAMVRAHHAAVLGGSRRRFRDVVLPEAGPGTIILGQNARRLAAVVDDLARQILGGPGTTGRHL